MEVKLLETEAEREAMYRLVHDEYVSQFYIYPQPDGRYVHYQGILDKIPQTDVFLAYAGEELVGTNSLTRDSENGIHTNIDFPKQTLRERSSGKVLVAAWRIVVKNTAREGAKVWKSLVKATIDRGLALKFDVALFTFNPKHWVAYHKVLNMELIGYNENAMGLIHAPEVLMRLKTKDLPKYWLTEER